MRSIDIVGINSSCKVDTDLVEIVEQATAYFPAESWDEIKYLGEFTVAKDLNISTIGNTVGALHFEKLIRKLGTIIKELGLENLLLGITPDPIVSMNYFLDRMTFRRAAYLVHDYVNARLGVVSLSSVDHEASCKVVAHGLGHSKGLQHHEKPLDLMHPALLRLPSLRVNGFCKTCLRDLEESKSYSS